MRDSIGGTMLFGIVLFLFSIFVIFIAFIIKYSRVYRIKNSIVNYVERNEGVDLQEDFETRLISLGYPRDGQYEICRYQLGDKGGYYKITLYSRTTFPVTGNVISLSIAITGETRTIETGVKIRDDGKNTTGWFVNSRDECKFCSMDDGSCTSYEV